MDEAIGRLHFMADRSKTLTLTRNEQTAIRTVLDGLDTLRERCEQLETGFKAIRRYLNHGATDYEKLKAIELIANAQENDHELLF
ncbi:hypothetical protein UFOVP124_4 [uncultured Caudovirales phage]|uniref:Uncharacterized protein n=1 Tax=uncultured Caudovirales phage TaxID=2100421 RepID=A0A6J5L7D7_9CAUD|nr:hypothetical protein UFOVP124_4 [uncultured Caudovirales phage]